MPAFLESLIGSGTSTYIVDGFTARPQQFPYQAALKVISSEGSGFCGGSIITNRHILSAAHCTAPPVQGVIVRVGSVKLNSGGVTFHVRKESIINHPQYDPKQLINDISVLVLPNTLTFSNSIQPVRLPFSIAHNTFEGAASRVSGWGTKNSHGGPYSEDLHFAQVRVISNAQCNDYFRASRRIQAGTLCVVGHSSHLTGAQNQGHCNGDSGGPLVTQLKNGHLIQIGVVSFAPSGDCLRKPGGLTRTGHYLDFIRNAVSGK